MKKVWVALLTTLLLTGCTTQEEANEFRIHNQKEEIAALENEIQELAKQKESLVGETTEGKFENGTSKYLITLEIKQSNFLDVGKAIRNSMNAIKLQIPVDKEYYDALEVGDVLDDTFRVGSLLMEGSFGSWKIKVTDKEVK